jgi:hypothetical protein
LDDIPFDNVKQLVRKAPSGCQLQRNYNSVRQLPISTSLRRTFEKIRRLHLHPEMINLVILNRLKIKHLSIAEKLNRTRIIRLMKNQNITRLDLSSYLDYLKKKQAPLETNVLSKFVLWRK